MVAELLAPERKVLDVTPGRCFPTHSTLPLAETSTANLLVVPIPIGVAPELSVPF
jgi:hypothetical protein